MHLAHNCARCPCAWTLFDFCITRACAHVCVCACVCVWLCFQLMLTECHDWTALSSFLVQNKTRTSVTDQEATPCKNIIVTFENHASETRHQWQNLFAVFSPLDKKSAAERAILITPKNLFKWQVHVFLRQQFAGRIAFWVSNFVRTAKWSFQILLF